MKQTKLIYIIVIVGVLTSLFGPYAADKYFKSKSVTYETTDKKMLSGTKVTKEKPKEIAAALEPKEDTKIKPVVAEAIIKKDPTVEQIANQLNKSLKSTLSGKGEVFAKFAKEYGVDPYLAVAIALHETGCNGTCSKLVRTCNNVGGMKGGSSTKCNGGSYASFGTIDDGIKAFVYNIKKNYVNYGLTTPEAMNKKYAASTTWATQVRSYMSKIKNR